MGDFISPLPRYYLLIMTFLLVNKDNERIVNHNIEPPLLFVLGVGVTTTGATTETITLPVLDAPLKSVAVSLNVNEAEVFGAIKLADNISALVIDTAEPAVCSHK